MRVIRSARCVSSSTMTPSLVRTCLAVALALGSLAPTPAHAEEPRAELRTPPAPTKEAQDRLAAMLAKALDPSLHAPLAVVVDDVLQRLRTREREVAEGKGEQPAIRDVIRAALRDADFANLTKKKRAVMEAAIDLVVLQAHATLHARVQEGIGHQLAMRAVRRCAGEVACLDAIAPTAAMRRHHIASVRKSFDGKLKELEAEERLGNFEIQRLMSTYNQMETLSSSVQKKADDTASGQQQKIG